MGVTESIGDMVAVRDVAGKYISELGAMNDRVVVVNADLAGTSRNRGFVERFPDRAFNVGIAEQDMDTIRRFGENTAFLIQKITG